MTYKITGTPRSFSLHEAPERSPFLFRAVGNDCDTAIITRNPRIPGSVPNVPARIPSIPGRIPRVRPKLPNQDQAPALLRELGNDCEPPKITHRRDAPNIGLGVYRLGARV